MSAPDRQPEDGDLLFGEILESLHQRRVQPEDPNEIAAFLESSGWNDSRAVEVFGVADVFELALNVWDAVQKRFSASNYIPAETRSFLYYVEEITRSFIRGLIFALPMAISVAAMLTIKFSLWSYQNLSTELATAIAIGTILSFMVVGGFMQVIARRGFFYLKIGYVNMARRVTFTFIRYGYLVVGIIAALIFLFNLLTGFFPPSMVFVIILYFFFLSSIWLSITVMYILRREFTFTGLVILGIGLIFVLFRLLHWGIIPSQIVSLTIVTAIGNFLVRHYFKIEEQKMEEGKTPGTARASVMWYSVRSYFIYGCFYFTFLFIDRIIAWSANSNVYMPFFLWFRGPYELGLDFGIIMLMIPMGIIEVVLNRVMMQIETSAKNHLGNETDQMNKNFVRIYQHSLIAVLAISTVWAVIVYYVVMWVDRLKIFDLPLIPNATTHFVFILALISYVLLSAALMNAISMFSLSQPEPIIKAIIPSMLINIFVGFICSRWASWLMDQFGLQGTLGVDGYAFAVLGLLAGCICFLVLSSRKAIAMLNRLDYCLYAAS